MLGHLGQPLVNLLHRFLDLGIALEAQIQYLYCNRFSSKGKRRKGGIRPVERRQA